MSKMVKLDILMQGSSFRTNLSSLGICTIALIRGENNILVDTGHFGNRRQILESLKRLNLTPSDIDKVVLTHSHWDHALNLELFSKATLVINSKELSYVRAVKGDDWATSCTLAYIIDRMKVQTTSGEQTIDKGVTVIETPGHSPGHQAVLVKTDEETALLTGDSMPTLRSYFRGLPDFITTSEDEAKQSIIRLKSLRPDTYYPGHDRAFKVIDGSPRYITHCTLKVIFRRETEENFGIVLGTEDSEKPERI
jgi:glyoxylase-like metal-dependent hydrolase (beta-lactamase superfamily II)